MKDLKIFLLIALVAAAMAAKSMRPEIPALLRAHIASLLDEQGTITQVVEAWGRDFAEKGLVAALRVDGERAPATSVDKGTADAMLPGTDA